MSKKKSSATKNGYQKMLSVYLKRRGLLKGKTNYAILARGINSRIHVCRLAIRRLEKYDWQLKKLDSKLSEFMGVSVFKISRCNKKLSVLAKRIFQREALESGIPSRHISIFCGVKNNKKISVARKRFIRSLQTNGANRDTWQRWKIFVEENGMGHYITQAEKLLA